MSPGLYGFGSGDGDEVQLFALTDGEDGDGVGMLRPYAVAERARDVGRGALESHRGEPYASYGDGAGKYRIELRGGELCVESLDLTLRGRELGGQRGGLLRDVVRVGRPESGGGIGDQPLLDRKSVV